MMAIIIDTPVTMDNSFGDTTNNRSLFPKNDCPFI